MKVEAIVLNNHSCIRLPKNVEVVSYATHLDGPRIWFFHDESNGEEFIQYSIKKYLMKIDTSEILNGKYFVKKIHCPINSVIAGMFFEKETWDAVIFLLEPKDEEQKQLLCIAKVEEENPIPDGYVYHSTALKPNFSTVHFVSKSE